MQTLSSPDVSLRDIRWLLGMSKIKKHYARNKKLLDYALSVKIYDVGCGTGKMGSVAFENFAPFTDIGKRIGLEKWRNYQISQSKSPEESEKHI